MRPQRFAAVIGFMVVIVVGPLHSAPIASAKSNPVIKIASQSPLTGGESAVGIGLRNGADLAIKQLGAPLHDQGFDVQLVGLDDQATPDVGVANAKQIAADPTILGVMAHYNSGVAIPSSTIYDANGLVLISPAATNPNLTDRGLLTVNRVSGRDDVVGEVDAEFASSLGLASAYIVNDSTTFGQGVAVFFRNNALEQGMDVRGFDTVAQGQDLGPTVTKIIAAAPQVVYLAGNADVLAPLVQALGSKGFKGKFIGPDGLDTPTFAKLAGDAGVGTTYYTTTGAPASVFKAAAQFIVDYKQAYGTEPPPYAAEAYDATGIMLAAIERAVEEAGGKVPTRQAVAAEVRATFDYKGLTGKITFDANGDRKIANYFILQVQTSDPAQWSANKIINQFQIASPLTAGQQSQ